jgi:hypothetical protein
VIVTDSTFATVACVLLLAVEACVVALVLRYRRMRAVNGPRWVLEPHKTNPNDVVMPRYSDPFESNIHEDASAWLDRLRRHQSSHA